MIHTYLFPLERARRCDVKDNCFEEDSCFPCKRTSWHFPSLLNEAARLCDSEVLHLLRERRLLSNVMIIITRTIFCSSLLFIYLLLNYFLVISWFLCRTFVVVAPKKATTDFKGKTMSYILMMKRKAETNIQCTKEASE